MTFQEKKELIAEVNPEALLADGFEDALIGYVQQGGKNTVVALYDYWACVSILIERDGLAEDEATDYLSVNTLGAWAGENTPAYAFLFNAAP